MKLETRTPNEGAKNRMRFSAHSLPLPHQYPEGSDWPQALADRLAGMGCEVFAAEHHVIVIARGALPEWESTLLRIWSSELHSRLLAEQGRPISEAETLTDLA